VIEYHRARTEDLPSLVARVREETGSQAAARNIWINFERAIRGTADRMAACRIAGWAATEEQRLIGFVIARVEHAGVCALYVADEAAQKTLGARLLALAERWLAGRGVVRAWLEANQRLLTDEFYTRRGWKPADRNLANTPMYTKRLPLLPSPAVLQPQYAG
jgi:GNAT superfamily N-acetyltransferase